MPRYIIKLSGEKGNFYLDWSTVVDAPVSMGMPLDQFEEYYRLEYGPDKAENELPERLKRVENTGSSSMCGESPDYIMGGNRAGPDEEELTIEEIYRSYCLRQPIRDGWTPS